MSRPKFLASVDWMTWSCILLATWGSFAAPRTFSNGFVVGWALGVGVMGIFVDFYQALYRSSKRLGQQRKGEQDE